MTEPSPPEKHGEHRPLSQQLDRELASRAYRKVMAGETPTVQERAALKRFESEQEEQRRWQYYAAIPQKHWRQMSGRQTKVLHEQAERYGLPFGERTINLSQVVRALHDFLAANARRLCQGEEELLVSGGPSPALERYRDERARLAKLDRLEREGVLVPKDEVRLGLGRIAAILRTAGESLQQQYGQAAAEILHEALDEAAQSIQQMCSGVEGDLPPPTDLALQESDSPDAPPDTTTGDPS